MAAIRQITQLENDIRTFRLPSSFKAKQVEVIVMLIDVDPLPNSKAPCITGDIISPVVPEKDWDALK